MCMKISATWYWHTLHHCSKELKTMLFLEDVKVKERTGPLPGVQSVDWRQGYCSKLSHQVLYFFSVLLTSWFLESLSRKSHYNHSDTDGWNVCDSQTPGRCVINDHYTGLLHYLWLESKTRHGTVVASASILVKSIGRQRAPSVILYCCYGYVYVTLPRFN